MRQARSIVATVGAVAGAICLLWTVGLAVAGVRPVVFMSGSMSPAIKEGDLAFVRTVPVDQVRAGDIVSVETESGRVTHRVVSVTPQGSGAALRLKGDANNSPDANPYTLSTVDEVVGHVPAVGHVLNAAASPWGMGLGGALLVSSLACALVPLFRKEAPAVRKGTLSRPRHRRVVRRPGRALVARVAVPTIVLGFVVGSTSLPAARTLAYFSDTPKLSTQVGGFETAPWFTCAQAMSGQSYGSVPWTHLNLNENSPTPQTSTTTPYFLTDTNTAWDGIYFVGPNWNNQLPSTGHTQGCRRDLTSYSVYLTGTTKANAQFIRIQGQSQNANGPSGARWNNFSVNVWFKTDTTAGDKAGVLAAYGKPGGSEDDATDRVLYLDSQGRVTFEVYPGAYHFRNSTTDYADNKWHMATATLGAAGQCLYVDGHLAQACDPAVTTAYQTSVAMFWRFGYAYLSDGFQGITDGNIEQRAFTGYVDDVAVWTRQMSASEIQSMYRAALPLRP